MFHDSFDFSSFHCRMSNSFELWQRWMMIRFKELSGKYEVFLIIIVRNSYEKHSTRWWFMASGQSHMWDEKMEPNSIFCCSNKESCSSALIHRSLFLFPATDRCTLAPVWAVSPDIIKFHPMRSGAVNVLSPFSSMAQGLVSQETSFNSWHMKRQWKLPLLGRSLPKPVSFMLLIG